MKKSSYKILLLFMIIVSVFFTKIVSVKADIYDDKLLSKTCLSINDCSSVPEQYRTQCEDQNEESRQCRIEYDWMITTNSKVIDGINITCNGKTGADFYKCKAEVISNEIDAYLDSSSVARKIKNTAIPSIDIDALVAKEKESTNGGRIDYTPVDELKIDCDDYDVFHKIWNALVLIAPFITIGLGIMDLFKIVTAAEMNETKKHKKNLIIRIIALILLIITPSLVYVLLSTLGLGSNNYISAMRCIVVGK